MNTLSNPTFVKVAILTAALKENEGTFKGKDGEDVEWSTRKQPARIEFNGFVMPYDVRLDKGQQPYPVGEYEMDVLAMLKIDKGAHSLQKFPVLIPIKSK
jgi:hypothetical protein